MAALATASAEPTGKPIEQCRLIYAYERGVKVVVGDDGTILITDEPSIAHEACEARYAARSFPMPHRRLADLLDDTDHHIAGIDRRGVVWLEQSDGGGDTSSIKLFRVTDETKPYFEAAPGYYSRERPRINVSWPWVGHNMLRNADGSTWVVSRHELHHVNAAGKELAHVPLTSGQLPEDTPAAWVLDGTNSSMHQLYRIGRDIWLVRTDYSRSGPSSAVVHSDGERATVALTHAESFVESLIHRDGQVFALMAKRQRVEGENVDTPARILRLTPEPIEVRRQRVAELIVALDDDAYPIREKASAELELLHADYIPLLEAAITQGVSAEQKHRMERAMRRIRQPDPSKVRPVTFEGMSAARLALVDRRGRQYIQQWVDGKPTDQWLVIDDGKVHRFDAPSETFELQCVGDGEFAYGRDASAIYRIDPSTFIPTPIIDLGDAGAAATLVAVREDQLCLAVPSVLNGSESMAYLWIDTQTPAEDPTLTGRPLLDGLDHYDNGQDHMPVVADRAGRLWAARWKVDGDSLWADDAKITTQLFQIDGVEVEQLSEPLVTGRYPTVWPLADGAAVVMTEHGNAQADGIILYDRGEAKHLASLEKLIVDHWDRLMRIAPDGTAMVCGEYYNRKFLIRLGDGVYFREDRIVATDDGKRSKDRSGIYRAGKPFKVNREEEKDDYRPMINRVMDVDAKTGRILGFVGSYLDFEWIAIDSNAKDEHLSHGSPAWAWHRANFTTWPYYDSSWGLTERSRDHMHAARDKRKVAAGDDYVEYLDSEFIEMQRWTEDGFRVLPRSLYGSSIWEDASGGVWQMRVRETGITYADGRYEILPLEAGELEQYRLVIESESAVWVAGQSHVVRYTTARDDDGRTVWRAAQRYRLPRLGSGFAGPWIAGDHLYWLSNGTLFGRPVSELR